MNTAPLYPRAWNIWAVALTGQPSAVTVVHQEISTLDRVKIWLNEVLAGKASDVALLEPQSRKVMRAREQMDKIPVLPAGDVFTVFIQFWYDGTSSAVPWPATNEAMALTVFAPDTTAPPPPTWQQQLSAAIEPAVSGGKSVLLTIGFAALLIGGAAYAISKAKSNWVASSVRTYE